MTHGILLVDAQREILRLLHSSLETLAPADLEIHEALSAEEALLAATNHKIDVLVVDTQLHGYDGLQLVHKIRAGHPDVGVILMHDHAERRTAGQLADVGAAAVFAKPVPLRDLLDAVEHALGLTHGLFQAGPAAIGEQRHARLSDLLANFRQDTGSVAVALLHEGGEVLARAGTLGEGVETPLLAALVSLHGAGRSVLKLVRSEPAQAYHVLRGSEYDVLLLAITDQHSLVVAGRDLADQERISETWQAMRALRAEVDRTLRSIGAAAGQPLKESAIEMGSAPVVEEDAPDDEADAILDLLDSRRETSRQPDLDSYWEQAARQHAGTPTNPAVINFEQARKMGLTPQKDEE